jgi:hypothetical protein
MWCLENFEGAIELIAIHPSIHPSREDIHPSPKHQQVEKTLEPPYNHRTSCHHHVRLDWLRYVLRWWAGEKTFFKTHNFVMCMDERGRIKATGIYVGSNFAMWDLLPHHAKPRNQNKWIVSTRDEGRKQLHDRWGKSRQSNKWRSTPPTVTGNTCVMAWWAKSYG